MTLAATLPRRIRPLPLALSAAFPAPSTPCIVSSLYGTSQEACSVQLPLHSSRPLRTNIPNMGKLSKRAYHGSSRRRLIQGNSARNQNIQANSSDMTHPLPPRPAQGRSQRGRRLNRGGNAQNQPVSPHDGRSDHSDPLQAGQNQVLRGEEYGRVDTMHSGALPTTTSPSAWDPTQQNNQAVYPDMDAQAGPPNQYQYAPHQFPQYAYAPNSFLNSTTTQGLANQWTGQLYGNAFNPGQAGYPQSQVAPMAMPTQDGNNLLSWYAMQLMQQQIQQNLPNPQPSQSTDYNPMRYPAFPGPVPSFMFQGHGMQNVPAPGGGAYLPSRSYSTNAPQTEGQGSEGIVHRTYHSGSSYPVKKSRKERSLSPRSKMVKPLDVPRPSAEYLEITNRKSQKTESPRDLLVILDMNGTLIHRPNPRKSIKTIQRPFLKKFLEFLGQDFRVMLWSSARPHNVEGMASSILTPEQYKSLLAVWGRDTLRLTEAQYSARVQVYKQLTWVFESDMLAEKHPRHAEGVKWDQTNTVLIDDSMLKAAAEPHNLILVEEFEATPDQMQGDALREVAGYLNALRYEDNVSAFIKEKPFRIGEGWTMDWEDSARGDVIRIQDPTEGQSPGRGRGQPRGRGQWQGQGQDRDRRQDNFQKPEKDHKTEQQGQKPLTGEFGEDYIPLN